MFECKSTTFAPKEVTVNPVGLTVRKAKVAAQTVADLGWRSYTPMRTPPPEGGSQRRRASATRRRERSAAPVLRRRDHWVVQLRVGAELAKVGPVRSGNWPCQEPWSAAEAGIFCVQITGSRRALTREFSDAVSCLGASSRAQHCFTAPTTTQQAGGRSCDLGYNW